MNKEILKLAIPNILTNITVPILGMVDIYLMGHLDSVYFLGAVALASAVFNFIYWGFAFLRMSTSGLAAQTYGREDRQEMALVLQRGLIIAIAGSLMLLILQGPLADFSFWLLEGSAEVKEQARRYYFVRIWDAPAAIMLMVIYGWFLGMQNSIYPMVIALTVNIVNIISSFILVRYFDMNVRGAALGTVIGQYSGLVLSVFLFLKKYRWVLPLFTRELKPLLNKMRHFLHVSGNIFIRTFFIILVFTFFTSKSAGIGDITLAANSVLLQYLMLFSYFLDGFAYAAEALVGKFFGASDKDKLSLAVKNLFKWGLGFALTFTLSYALLGETLLSLFTVQEEVIARGKQYLFWVVMIPLVSYGSYIWDGIFIGITGSVEMRNSVVISAVFFFFVPFYLLFPVMGNHAMWLSMMLFMASRSLSLSLFFPKVIKRELKA
ncbi:MAG TPA: MATE family efflux transporter [Marinilabiliaceae bacterium]|nr:MATE family efflux transporter [Marinilabiliaceae bacterium]